MPTTPQASYSADKLRPFQNPHRSQQDAVALAPNLTVPKGSWLGQITATGKFALYVDANGDGTGVAKCICPFECRSDANGMITLGDIATGMDRGEKLREIEVWFHGDFLVSELVGHNAAALADVRGVEVNSVAGKQVISF